MALGVRFTCGPPRGEKLENFSSYTAALFCYVESGLRKCLAKEKAAGISADSFF